VRFARGIDSFVNALPRDNPSWPLLTFHLHSGNTQVDESNPIGRLYVGTGELCQHLWLLSCIVIVRESLKLARSFSNPEYKLCDGHWPSLPRGKMIDRVVADSND